MLADPFKRLRELVKQNFPEGDPTKIELHIGNPSGEPNPKISQFLRDNLDLGKYHPVATSPELKEAIKFYASKVHGVKLDDSQVSAVQGTKSALAWMPAILLPEGRGKLLIPDLSYTTYFTAPNRLGVDISFYDASKKLEKIHNHPDLVVVNTPLNPLGRVMWKNELEGLVDQAQEERIILVSDECYIDIYSKNKPPSILKLDKTGKHTGLLAFNSLSKAASLPGLRSGFVAGDSKLVSKFSEEYATTGNTLSAAHQAASAMAWRDINFIASNRERYNEFIMRFARKMNLPLPEGAFYFFYDTGIDSERFTINLLRNHGIKVMPGKYLDYSQSGRWDNFVRIPVTSRTSEEVVGAIKDETRN